MWISDYKVWTETARGEECNEKSVRELGAYSCVFLLCESSVCSIVNELLNIFKDELRIFSSNHPLPPKDKCY